VYYHKVWLLSLNSCFIFFVVEYYFTAHYCVTCHQVQWRLVSNLPRFALCYSNGTTNGTSNGSIQPRFSTGSSSDVITSILNGLSATHLAPHTPHNNAVAIEDMVVVMKPRPCRERWGCRGMRRATMTVLNRDSLNRMLPPLKHCDKGAKGLNCWGSCRSFW